MPKLQIRVRASVAVHQDDKILLVPHIYPNRELEWFLPGGGVEFGETLRETALRELLEETGFIAELAELLLLEEVIEPETPYHGLNAVFSGRITGGEIRAENHLTHGLKEPQWFSKEKLHGKIYKPKALIDQLLGIV